MGVKVDYLGRGDEAGENAKNNNPVGRVVHEDSGRTNVYAPVDRDWNKGHGHISIDKDGKVDTKRSLDDPSSLGRPWKP